MSHNEKMALIMGVCSYFSSFVVFLNGFLSFLDSHAPALGVIIGFSSFVAGIHFNKKKQDEND
jgi:uncharacterized membrane-anchored protein